MADGEVLDERARRRALNEAAFREVNEKMAGLNKAFSVFSNEFVIVCECDDTACLEQIQVSPEQYEAVRSDPTTFFVIADHESPAVEVVVEKHGDYNVVRKRPGDPERVAVATDPRSPS